MLSFGLGIAGTLMEGEPANSTIGKLRDVKRT